MDKLNFKINLLKMKKWQRKWILGKSNVVVEYILKYFKDYETKINNSKIEITIDIILNKYK